MRELIIPRSLTDIECDALIGCENLNIGRTSITRSSSLLCSSMSFQRLSKLSLYSSSPSFKFFFIHIILKNSFSKKVHKYTFGELQCCFYIEYKDVMQLRSGCTLSWKYTRSTSNYVNESQIEGWIHANKACYTSSFASSLTVSRRVSFFMETAPPLPMLIISGTYSSLIMSGEPTLAAK